LDENFSRLITTFDEVPLITLVKFHSRDTSLK
jgi:hypothetical protein